MLHARIHKGTARKCGWPQTTSHLVNDLGALRALACSGGTCNHNAKWLPRSKHHLRSRARKSTKLTVTSKAKAATPFDRAAASSGAGGSSGVGTRHATGLQQAPRMKSGAAPFGLALTAAARVRVRRAWSRALVPPAFADAAKGG